MRLGLIELLPMLVLLGVTAADMNKNRAYIELTRPIPCIRRFNTTHQIGCSGVQTGIVYAVRSQTEFTRLTDRITPAALGSRRLVVVAWPTWFVRVLDWSRTAPNAERILSGLVLIEQANTTTSLSYSDDVKSPNSLFSAYVNSSTIEWNPNGRETIFLDFNIPIYIITDPDEATQPFDNCYNKFNRVIFERVPFKIDSTDLLCGMQLGMDMSGAVSSRVCTRRSNIIHTLDINYFCDPLGGSTYLTPLTLSKDPLVPSLLISARLDTFTLFESYTPGADEPISGLIALFVLADLLGSVSADLDRLRPVFVLFDNEAFDYGGSARFVRDLVHDNLPIVDLLDGKTTFNLDKDRLAALVELSQWGSIGINDANKLFVHKDPATYTSNKTIASLIDDMNSKLQNYSNGDITPITSTSAQLPPSSAHAFLREKIALATLSVTAHNEMAFTNNAYHSVFDTAQRLDINIPDNLTEPDVYSYTTRFARRLEPLVLALAQTLYSLGSSKSVPSFPTSNQTLPLINRLVYCFYKNSSCDYFKSIMPESYWPIYTKLLKAGSPPDRLSFYTSVNDNLMSGKFISLQLLRYFTRIRELDTLNATECSKDSLSVKQFQATKNLTIKVVTYVKGDSTQPSSKCIATMTRLTSAVSPAFDRFDDGELVQTNLYSAWTESSWVGVDVQVRMFMFSQPAVSGVTLALGIVATLVALALTWLFNKYADKWFLIRNNPEQSTEFID